MRNNGRNTVGTEHTLNVQDDLLLTYRRVGYNDCIEMVEMGLDSRYYNCKSDGLVGKWIAKA